MSEQQQQVPFATSPAASNVLVDHKEKDYRGFIFAVHPEWGLLLLHCTRKKQKGPHFQLPGGHVDEEEFVAAARDYSDAKSQLLQAAKVAAARELWEESGLDVRNQLERLEPASLRTAADAATLSKKKELLTNELKNRLFYFLAVTDKDFYVATEGIEVPPNAIPPLDSSGSHLMLRLSVEHSGFVFEQEPTTAAEMLKHHSGGHISEALLLAMTKRDSVGASGSAK